MNDCVCLLSYSEPDLPAQSRVCAYYEYVSGERKAWCIHTEYHTLVLCVRVRSALFVYFICNKPFNRQLIILPCRWVTLLLLPAAHGHRVESEPISCLFHERKSFSTDK